MSASVYIDDVLRERWDDATRTYTSWNADGVLIEQRPYISTENTRGDIDTADGLVAANTSSLRADVRAQIDALKALVGSSTDPAGTNTLRAIRATPNSTINAGPAPYIQALAKAQIDTVQALVRISRLIVGALNDTSTAPQAPTP